MFVKEDFKHLKMKPNRKLQRFPPRTLNWQKINLEPIKHDQGYLKYVKNLFHKFAFNCTVHGMNRIFESNSNKYKRRTWIVGVVLCFMVLMYVSYRVAYKYHSNPLETVVATNYLPVFKIPFPEVTICNRNRFNWQRFEMAKQVYLKPRHRFLPEYQEIFFQVVDAHDTLSFGKFYKFKNLTKISPYLLRELSYVNFQTVAEFLAWKCHEIFHICKWLDDEYSCCDLFFKRNSQLGSCLAFNTIESVDGLDKQRFDPFWPWRTKGEGTFNGLYVKIYLREQDHSPRRINTKGILVMLAEPSVWFNEPIKVHTHTTTSIAITGILNTYSNYTRVISPTVRKCLFQNELNNQYYKSLPNRAYMYENCRAQCQLEHLLKYCNCTISIFYPRGKNRPCRLPDFPCLFYHNEKFNNFEQNAKYEYIHKHVSDVMKCTCFNNCKSLTYDTTITTAYMSNLEMDFNNSFIELYVFFQSQFVTEFLTTVLYTTTDLMASFGGLAGLCVGCSLLFLVEIAYFIVIDIPQKTLSYFKMRKDLKLLRKSRDVKMNLVREF